MYRTVPVSALFANMGYPICAHLTQSLSPIVTGKKSGSRQGYNPPGTAGMQRAEREMSVRNTSEERVVKRENLGRWEGWRKLPGRSTLTLGRKYIPRYQTWEHFILSVGFHNHRIPTVRGILQKLSESRYWLDFVNNLKDKDTNFKELVQC